LSGFFSNCHSQLTQLQSFVFLYEKKITIIVDFVWLYPNRLWNTSIKYIFFIRLYMPTHSCCSFQWTAHDLVGSTRQLHSIEDRNFRNIEMFFLVGQDTGKNLRCILLIDNCLLPLNWLTMELTITYIEHYVVSFRTKLLCRTCYFLILLISVIIYFFLHFFLVLLREKLVKKKMSKCQNDFNDIVIDTQRVISMFEQ
jgi:hypothetical protein